MSSLVEELQTVQSRKDLLSKNKRVKRLFTQLATLSIEARQFCDSHPELQKPATDEPIAAELKAEILRLYAIDGVREIVEEAQEEGLDRLDEFEAALKKSRKWSRRPSSSS